MKKNRMMRLASGLLVAVLITTSMISGTFAKYVTTASASDTARVAKWGVEVTTSGNLFGEMYENNTNGNKVIDTASDTMTVESFNSASVVDSVVAPGTKNDSGITFSITGKPEVDVNVTVSVTAVDEEEETAVDIFLNEGTYLDMTTGTSTVAAGGVIGTTGDVDKFELNEAYYPIKYTLVQTTTNGTYTLIEKGTLADVETELEKITTTTPYDANTDLGSECGTYKLTWEWDFDDNGAGTNDKADTFLGNLIADTVPADAKPNNADYSLYTNLKIAITVTQVD